MDLAVAQAGIAEVLTKSGELQSLGRRGMESWGETDLGEQERSAEWESTGSTVASAATVVHEQLQRISDLSELDPEVHTELVDSLRAVLMVEAQFDLRPSDPERRVALIDLYAELMGTEPAHQKLENALASVRAGAESLRERAEGGIRAFVGTDHSEVVRNQETLEAAEKLLAALSRVQLALEDRPDPFMWQGASGPELVADLRVVMGIGEPHQIRPTDDLQTLALREFFDSVVTPRPGEQ